MLVSLVLSTLLFTSFVGDANTNGTIDADEMGPFAECVGSSTEFCLWQFDVDMDNDVDLFDYSVFQSTFGLNFNNNIIVQKAKEQGWDMTSNNAVHLDTNPYWEYNPLSTVWYPPNQLSSYVATDGGRIMFYVNDEFSVKFFWQRNNPYVPGTIQWATGKIEQYAYCKICINGRCPNVDISGYCPDGSVGSNGYRLVLEENNLCATINGDLRCGSPVIWIFGKFPKAEIIPVGLSMMEMCETEEMQTDALGLGPPARMCLCLGNQAGHCSSNQCDAGSGCGSGDCIWYEPPDMSCGGFAVWTMVIPCLHMFFMKHRLRRRYCGK